VKLTVHCFHDGSHCFFSYVKIGIMGGDNVTFTTNGKVVICQVCDKKTGCSLKLKLEQHTWSAPHTKNKPLQCSKNQVFLAQMQQESGIRTNFSKTCAVGWWPQIFCGTNSKCKMFIIFWKSIAKGKFQTNLHSTRTIWMHAISPWIPKCIQCSMAHIHSNFSYIPHSIKNLETTGLSLQESMDNL
jgi:hypothetical protein